VTSSPAAATDSFDVIVVGGGPPGENAASYAVDGSGLTAALVERELVGGECSYWACMPSKAMLRPLEALDAAAHVDGAAQAVTGELDRAAVLARRDGFVHGHDDSSQVQWLESTGITLVRGHGRLAGERAVAVELADGTTRTLTARHAVVLATGSGAALPPIEGLREAAPWTSRDVTNVHEVPRRVVVLGGGVVACESATWLRGLGAAQVTILERGERLLGNQEPFAGDLVAQRFADVGVDVRTGTAVTAVRRGPVSRTDEGYPRGAEVTVVTAAGEFVADEVVAALGRTANSTDIGLDTVGLDPGEHRNGAGKARGGYVVTDDTMTVSGVDGQWLYAVGDVTGRALLTHQGKYQARVAGDVIAARAAGTPLTGSRFFATADHGQVPQVTFTSPQVASVGLTEATASAEASSAGRPVATVEYDLGSVAGASLVRDGYTGRAKLVIDPVREVLLGATFVGYDVAELLHSATVAVVGGVDLETLWHAVPAYPTVSEIWLRLLETWRAQRA